MAIPKEILAVERPKSTRVKYSNGRYLVVKRTSKRVGNRTVPVELGTIGEIKDGKYVEIRKEPRKTKDGKKAIEIKDYGEIALCDAAGKDVLDDLKKIYDAADAIRIYVLALMRSANHDICNRDIKLAYETSFASEMYPDVHLSENTISSFLEDIGMAYSKMSEFMRARVEQYAGKEVVIDGMLKDCNSETDTFSEFSRKGSKKGSKDLSLIYAYNPESREPVACKPYPGNMLDMTSIEDFALEYKFSSGIIVMDKGFYNRNFMGTIKAMGGISYIIPLKQSSKLVVQNEMNKDIVSLLADYKDAHIFWKKKKVSDDCFLYAFRDPKGAYDQELGFLTRVTKKGTYSEEKYLDKHNEFGLIVFESNSDLNPLDVYNAYAKRWEIEVMFDFYKNIIELKNVRVHGDYRVYATEFINFLSVLISCRVRKKLRETGVSQKYSYKQIFHYLSKSKRIKLASEDTWSPNRTVKYISDLMCILGV